MLKKYNIALIPTTVKENFIKNSQYFYKISDQYQLGEKSLPHVTLYQFHAKEQDIEQVWMKICGALLEHSIRLEFKEFSYITFNNTIFWISLLPDQRDALNKMHQLVAKTVNVPINKSYDPHLTLVNTKNKKYKEIANELEKSYLPTSDDFVLALGECDDIGQFTKIIYKSEMRKMACKL